MTDEQMDNLSELLSRIHKEVYLTRRILTRMNSPLATEAEDDYEAEKRRSRNK